MDSLNGRGIPGANIGAEVEKRPLLQMEVKASSLATGGASRDKGFGLATLVPEPFHFAIASSSSASSGIGSRGLDFPLPWGFLQGVFRGAPRPAKRQSPSSVSWVRLRAWNTSLEVSRGHPKQMT